MQTTATDKQARCAPLSTLALCRIITLILAVSVLLLLGSRTIREIHASSFPVDATPTSSTNVTSSNITRPSYRPRRRDPRQKDLFFISTQSTKLINASQPGSPPCVIFSCSSSGYFLVDPHLRFHKARLCDRIHFTGNTTDQNGKTISPLWCRVAILRDMARLFERYQKIVYVDIDVVYDEAGFLGLECGTGLKSVIITTKFAKGITILRTCSIVFCNRTDDEMLRLVQTWAGKHRQVRLMDQTVFNENWGCDQVNCVTGGVAKKAERRHCGSWLSKMERLKCFETP